MNLESYGENIQLHTHMFLCDVPTTIQGNFVTQIFLKIVDEMWMTIKVYKYGILNEFHPWTSNVEWILIVYEWKMYIRKWTSFGNDKLNDDKRQLPIL
jgi:hypothetical protein